MKKNLRYAKLRAICRRAVCVLLYIEALSVLYSLSEYSFRRVTNTLPTYYVVRRNQVVLVDILHLSNSCMYCDVGIYFSDYYKTKISIRAHKKVIEKFYVKS